jgi:hypothetical protein
MVNRFLSKQRLQHLLQRNSELWTLLLFQGRWLLLK